MKRFIYVLLLLIGSLSFAEAQAPTKLCIPSAVGNNCITIERVFPLPVTSQCDSSVAISVAAGTTTQLVGLTTGDIIRVCSFVLTSDTAATTAKFIYGTGVACAGSPADITGAMRMVDEGNIVATSLSPLFSTAVSNALCLVTATGAVTGFITYTKY